MQYFGVRLLTGNTCSTIQELICELTEKDNCQSVARIVTGKAIFIVFAQLLSFSHCEKKPKRNMLANRPYDVKKFPRKTFVILGSNVTIR